MRLIALSVAAALTLTSCDGGAPPAEPPPAPEVKAPEPEPEPAAEAVAAPSLNLNTATREAFKAGVPGLGDKMAHEFEEYRPYVSIAQFRKEMAKYVDAAKIAEYERYVFVPIDPNKSDAATLQQLPGLSAEEAEGMIAQRPFADAAAFKAALAEEVTEAELAAAEPMLAP